jgi:hypothetical protein
MDGQAGVMVRPGLAELDVSSHLQSYGRKQQPDGGLQVEALVGSPGQIFEVCVIPGNHKEWISPKR